MEVELNIIHDELRIVAPDSLIPFISARASVMRTPEESVAFFEKELNKAFPGIRVIKNIV